MTGDEEEAVSDDRDMAEPYPSLTEPSEPNFPVSGPLGFPLVLPSLEAQGRRVDLVLVGVAPAVPEHVGQDGPVVDQRWDRASPEFL